MDLPMVLPHALERLPGLWVLGERLLGERVLGADDVVRGPAAGAGRRGLGAYTTIFLSGLMALALELRAREYPAEPAMILVACRPLTFPASMPSKSIRLLGRLA